MNNNTKTISPFELILASERIEERSFGRRYSNPDRATVDFRGGDPTDVGNFYYLFNVDKSQKILRLVYFAGIANDPTLAGKFVVLSRNTKEKISDISGTFAIIPAGAQGQIYNAYDADGSAKISIATSDKTFAEIAFTGQQVKAASDGGSLILAFEVTAEATTAGPVRVVFEGAFG